MAEPYYPLYFNWIEDTQELNDQEKGRLIDAIVLYARGDNWQERIKGNERYVFPLFKGQVDRARKVPENQKDRNTSKAVKWRKDVFEKDGYRCCICKQTGGRLNAHHIKPWAEFPELRFDVNNGDTLCESCHREVHRRMRLRQKVK